MALATLVSLSLAGCGSDAASSPSSLSGPATDAAELTVVAQTSPFPRTPTRPKPENWSSPTANEGDIKHTLVVEGVSGFKLEVGANGDVDTGRVELQPGQYSLSCDVARHRQEGMEATLEVA